MVSYVVVVLVVIVVVGGDVDEDDHSLVDRFVQTGISLLLVALVLFLFKFVSLRKPEPQAFRNLTSQPPPPPPLADIGGQQHQLLPNNFDEGCIALHPVCNGSAATR
jgi:hypothetical protein